MDQRYLLYQENDHRNVQSFRVPDVRNMDTTYIVQTQDTSIVGSNTMLFTQNLTYNTSPEPGDPDSFSLLPFMDVSYKEILLKQLRKYVDSLVALSSISTPIIVEPTTGTEEEPGLSIGAIFGVVVSVIVILALVVGVGKFITAKNGCSTVYSEYKDDFTGNANQTSENGTGTVNDQNRAVGVNHEPVIHEHLEPTTTDEPLLFATAANSMSRLSIDPPAQANDHIDTTYQAKSRGPEDPPAKYNKYVVTYKDQSRSVTGLIVQAEEHTSSDGRALPIATAVPLKNAKPPPLFEA